MDRSTDSSACVASYTEVLPALCERFRDAGAAAVVLVDGSALGRIEQIYGIEAHRRVCNGLAHSVSEATKCHVATGDLLVRGDAGSDELFLFLFRSRRDSEFYREGLPAVVRSLREAFEKQATRILYPYFSESPGLPVGSALALHNPTLAEPRQLVRVLESARREAELAARIAERDAQRRFFEVVMAEEITTLYEPIVNLETRELLGYEALSRGPAGTAVEAPGALFAMAARTKLLFELDCLCRRNALRGARGLAPGTKLFLNCLPTAIRDPSFRGEALRQSLEHLQLEPHDVVLEISEKESIDNFAIFREARDHFASLGLGIALDDTGVGYSSLEAVMELSPDFIKVDQVLVRSIDSDAPRQALLRGINALASTLGAQVIAEGIETSEELATLQRLEIPFGQGYLLGRPAPLRRWL